MICEKKSKRLGIVRSLVYEMQSSFKNQKAWAHLSGVSTFASMLAMRRGQDSEIAAIAGCYTIFISIKLE